MDVEQHDVWCGAADHRDRARDIVRLTDDLDAVAELGPHARAEQPMIIDDHHAHRVGSRHDRAIAVAISSWISVPNPGELRTMALPPCRSIRPMIDSFTPRRSLGTAAASNPRPRSRMNTVAFAASSSA